MMTDDEKSQKLSLLIDDLCKPDFCKDNTKASNWIAELKEIYADGYRHTYSRIFNKMQTILSNCNSSDNTEMLDSLGENLNSLGRQIDELCAQDPDDADLKNASIRYKKFSDHINLEIGRYNFIRLNLINKQDSCYRSSIDSSVSSSDLNKFQVELEKMAEDINSIRPVTTRAQKQLDGLDEKLEKNKISSLTTLTIFSAVILAFTGGITFETGTLKGMFGVSRYRLIFIVCLTGFILFNTIFALLYIVGKMTEKPISTKCRYMVDKPNIRAFSGFYEKRCGNGYCSKSCSSVTIFCRILHKYSYVFAINVVLLYIMYLTFWFWYFKDELCNWKVFGLQVLPLGLVLVFFLCSFIETHVQIWRIRLVIKLDIVTRCLGKDDLVVNNISTYIQQVFRKLTFKEQLYKEFLNQVKDMSAKTRCDYKSILKALDEFSDNKALANNCYLMCVSRGDHRINKKKWKKIKVEFRDYLNRRV